MVPQSHPNHVAITTEKQTVAFNIQARINFKNRRRARMGIWEAMEMLDTLVDESDPDVSLCRYRPQVNVDTDATSLSSLHRLACPRSNIFYKPLRLFVVMANPSGCK